MTESKLRRSKLVAAGFILIAVGLVLPSPFLRAARLAADYPARVTLAFLSDLFRLCILPGLGCLLIGWLRNRRWKGESRRSAARKRSFQ